jgi:hypothetical protein
MTRYLFARIDGRGPIGEIGQATVSGWGAEPIVDALRVLLEEREGSATPGVYKYRSLDDKSGLDGGRIKLGSSGSLVLTP